MLVLSALAAGAPAPAGPKDSAQAKAKLAAVRARINDLTSRLGKQLKERDSLSARLREAELAITSKRRHLDDLRTEQGEVERHRAALLAEQARDATVIGQERESLAAQVRAAYMIGRQEELTLLLNQNSPAALGRTFAYYGYFARQRVTRIASIGEDVARLEQLVSDIDAQTDKLKGLQQDTTREMAALQNARADRADSVAALSKQLESGNEELGKLKREEQAVESLVADLQRMLQDFPSDPSKSFADMRGKLPWPVPGKLAAQYQASREGSAVRWNGIMIKTPPGTKVRAPFYGRVVYADWLQGLGLLLIVGHGGGYMTLYGHAEVLYKGVGDSVAPGDVVAAMPDGGEPQLYFEIREGRKTVDPKGWLRNKP